MELGVSKEDYLKVIYQLTKQYGSARVNRIAEELNYTPASTSVAVNKLEALGFVQRNHDRSIVPTPMAMELAEKLFKKYHFLVGFFCWLGVPGNKAMKDADKMEHILSDKSFEKICVSVKKHKPQIEKLAVHCLATGENPSEKKFPKEKPEPEIKEMETKKQYTPKILWDYSMERFERMPMSGAERCEDIMETIGEWYTAGKSSTIEELSQYFGNTLAEVRKYLAELAARDQIFPVKGKRDPICPTSKGLEIGAKAMEKHKIMSEFFQLIGVNEDQAEAEACRMEHVVSDDSVMRLNTFLCNDGKYERVITGYNLYARYRMGTYPGIMGMYEMDDNSCPRRLVEEFYHYKRDILLKVEPESCYFVLQWKSEKDQMKEQKNVWYKNPGMEWTMAQRTEAGECIPIKPFEFVFIPDDPVVEASVLITFLPAEVKKFSLDVLENIYELNVEIW